MEIAEREILHRGGICFTPHLPDGRIDAVALGKIVDDEYSAAGISPRQVFTGAVIITGESACSANSSEVVEALSGYAGDFVVATAGADHESFLAGCGSGAAEMSGDGRVSVINFDIGGGTTNAAVFAGGSCVDAYAIDIGGRLVRIGCDGTVLYVSERLSDFISSRGISLKAGVSFSFNEVKKLTDALTEILVKAFSGGTFDEAESALFIDHGCSGLRADAVTFSGGVAACLYGSAPASTLAEISVYGDIGPLLGRSIRESFLAAGIPVRAPSEIMQATVIGAGAYSLSLSGSTIVYDEEILPLRNIPVVRIFDDAENYDHLASRMRSRSRMFDERKIAFFMKGPFSPDYETVKKIARGIADYSKNNPDLIIFIIENDCAKAVGQTLQMLLNRSDGIVCIDGISADTGDYIDIGNPVSGVIPAVIKTLAFRKSPERKQEDNRNDS
jgi:ethanolamine utilization protein EutA